MKRLALLVVTAFCCVLVSVAQNVTVRAVNQPAATVFRSIVRKDSPSSPTDSSQTKVTRYICSLTIAFTEVVTIL